MKKQIDCSECKEKYPERSVNDLCDYDCDCGEASTNPFYNTMPHNFRPEKRIEIANKVADIFDIAPGSRLCDGNHFRGGCIWEHCLNTADYILSKLESYKAELRKEIEKETTENLKVDFLRQYLNESNLWKGKMLTNEDLIGFIKIAYKL